MNWLRQKTGICEGLPESGGIFFVDLAQYEIEALDAVVDGLEI